MFVIFVGGFRLLGWFYNTQIHTHIWNTVCSQLFRKKKSYHPHSSSPPLPLYGLFLTNNPFFLTNNKPCFPKSGMSKFLKLYKFKGNHIFHRQCLSSLTQQKQRKNFKIILIIIIIVLVVVVFVVFVLHA